MIEWQSLVLVAVVSLVAAGVVVTVVSVGIRLLESAHQARENDASAGRIRLVLSKILFGLCGLLVLFGVYLIVPALH